MIIVIKDFAKNALSEKAGTMLREKILQAYTTNQSENIVLDFNEINLFATMFFNASIGYLIQENKDEILEKKLFLLLLNLLISLSILLNLLLFINFEIGNDNSSS